MLNPDFRDMLSAFTGAGVEYLVVGAYALAAHGHPRATGDLDLWVSRRDGNAQRVLKALEAFGAPTEGLGAEDLSKRDVVIQIGIEPRRIDILTDIDGVEFEVAWESRLVATVAGLELPILSRRDLIANKRAVGRPQDLADLAALDR